MSGTVKQDKARGSWYFVVDVPAPDGSRRQMRRRGFETKKAAAGALAALVTDMTRGTFVRPTKTDVRTFLVDDWLPAKRVTLKPSTAACYEQMLTSYVLPRLGGVELAKVDGGTLNALYADLLAHGRTGASGRSGGLSPKTVRNVHGILHRAFADAVRWKRLAVNPCDSADRPRWAEPEMQAWTAEQLRAFLAHVATDRHAGPWHLLVTTGMRRGELLGLRWSDVDLAAARLTIRHTLTMVGDRPEPGTPKTRAGGRTIALDAATTAALKAWKAVQAAERLAMGAGWQDADGLVVTDPDGTPVHPQVFSRRFKTHAERAGLPVIRLHDTRHSYATAALAAGVPVKVLSQRLGHADVGVTLKIYAHVMPGDDEAAANTVAAAILGNSVTTS
jgi:integrase